MKSDKDKEKAKQTYQKPKLRTIELAAEEVLAVGCKLVSGGSNFGSPTTCNVPSCSVEGS
jgi:hypothetical protein